MQNESPLWDQHITINKIQHLNAKPFSSPFNKIHSVRVTIGHNVLLWWH